MPRGRPPSRVKPIVIRVALYLRPDADDDLIEFFAPIPIGLRSSAVKQALRSGQLTSSITNLPSDDEIEAALDGLLG
jgi:hypothetical protein